MEPKGNLHVEEEFNKAKRNALWFCSFAVLLWLVRAPEGGLQAPMLGTDARIDTLLLRALVWIACVYCLVGFYRQAKNVDRLNSEILYTIEFESIQARLANLSETFESLVQRTNELLQIAAPVRFEQPPDLEPAPERLLAQLREALSETNALVTKIDPVGPESDEAIRSLRMTWQSAQKGIELAVHQEFRLLNEGQGQNAAGLADLEKIGASGRVVALAISDMSNQFHRLSNQIRGEHKMLYTWYDKYLTYLMFILATIASGWEIIYAPASYVIRVAQPMSGWLALGAAILLVWASIRLGKSIIARWPKWQHRRRMRKLAAISSEIARTTIDAMKRDS